MHSCPSCSTPPTLLCPSSFPPLHPFSFFFCFWFYFWPHRQTSWLGLNGSSICLCLNPCPQAARPVLLLQAAAAADPVVPVFSQRFFVLTHFLAYPEYRIQLASPNVSNWVDYFERKSKASLGSHNALNSLHSPAHCVCVCVFVYFFGLFIELSLLLDARLLSEPMAWPCARRGICDLNISELIYQIKAGMLIQATELRNLSANMSTHANTLTHTKQTPKGIN